MSKRIVIIYVVNYLTNMLINFDHGIIPACTKEMKNDLNIDDVQLGMLGSAVYGGLVTGSIVGSSLFSFIKTKTIVTTSIIACIFSLSLFLFTRSIYILFLSRFLVGFFQCHQVFLVVFYPVWIDFFAGKHKTIWLTFMQLGVAFGAVLGYLVTSLFISHGGNWQQPYEFQILFLIPCSIFYLTCREENLDTQGSIEETESQYQVFYEILSNKLFCYTMLALSSLFFVVTGIQFWISDYFRIVLNVPQHIVFKAYLIVSLTAPIIGVGVGGVSLHYFGGYDGEYALTISTIEAFLASIVATCIPFLDNFIAVVILLWFLLFLGGKWLIIFNRIIIGALVPGLTGIMIISIPAHQRSIGNSLSHVFQELLGYLPSPVLYGLVQKLTGGAKSRYGLVLLVCWSYLGLIFMVLAQRYTLLNQKNKEGKVDQFNIPLRNMDFGQEISVSQGNSVIMRSRTNSIDNSLRESFQFGRLKKQGSLIDSFNHLATLVGRGSMSLSHYDSDDEGEIKILKRVNTHEQLIK